MAKTDIYPVGLFLSPRFAIHRLEGLVQKHGMKAVLTKSCFKAEREAWITGVFAFALGKMTKQQYWVGIVSEDTSPDTLLINFKETDGNTIKEVMHLEIFEWESHSQGTLVNAIRRKLRDKKYPEYFSLLCYAHRPAGEKLDTARRSDGRKRMEGFARTLSARLSG